MIIALLRALSQGWWLQVGGYRRAPGVVSGRYHAGVRNDAEEHTLGEGEFGEALRASPEFVNVAIPLLLTLFPGCEVMRSSVGRLSALYVDPPLEKHEARRLLGFLFELVERPEWRGRCAVAREVSDADGTRLELVLPLAPSDYDGGEALVGPFATDDAAKEWVSSVADRSLAFDTMLASCGYLVDLFVLGPLLDD